MGMSFDEISHIGDAYRRGLTTLPHLHVNDDAAYVIRIEVKASVSGENLAELLGNAIKSSSKISAYEKTTTVWVDVQTNDFPDYVVEALEACHASSIGIVITHQKACSHMPGLPLPLAAVERLNKVVHDGMIWHPFSRRQVKANKLNSKLSSELKKITNAA